MDAMPHTVAADPGLVWSKDPEPAVDAPPDEVVDPAPEARWPIGAVRTGVYGVVTPNVVALPDGTYRMYYTQILPRPALAPTRMIQPAPRRGRCRLERIGA